MPILPDADWPLWANLVAFAAAAIVIGVAGSRMAGLADRIADETGLGEAIIGAILLGVSTSLPGISASVTAAAAGFASLTVSNAAGGIAAQTAFLAVADAFYPRANLEHAAASVTNMIHCCMLVILLTLLLWTMNAPADWTLGHVHIASPILVISYILGLRLAFRSSERPMWRPRHTERTVEDIPTKQEGGEPLRTLIVQFGVVAAFILTAGVVVAEAGSAIVIQTGMSESVMGGIFVAVSTSLPELVTTIAAVRRGALTLAVGDIVGGNAFDVLFVCAADVAYTDGSIYHAAEPRVGLLVATAILVNAVLLLGLLQREERGFASIGFESTLIMILYALGIGVVAFGF